MHGPIGAALISVSIALSQTPASSVSRGVSVYSPAFAGTKLILHGDRGIYIRFEKLAKSFYAIVPGRDSNPPPLDRESDALRNTTTPPYIHAELKVTRNPLRFQHVKTIMIKNLTRKAATAMVRVKVKVNVDLYSAWS